MVNINKHDRIIFSPPRK